MANYFILYQYRYDEVCPRRERFVHDEHGISQCTRTFEGFAKKVVYFGEDRSPTEWEELLERLEDDIAKSILEKDIEHRDNVDVQIIGVSKL